MDIDLGIPSLTLPLPELPSFPDVVDKIKSSVVGIFSPVGGLLNSFIGSNLKKAAEPLLKELFERLKLLLKDLAFVASELLNKTETLAKGLIDQILKGISGLRAEVESMVSNILVKAQDTVDQMTQKVRDNLIAPFFMKVDALRESLVKDVIAIIDKMSDEALKILNETGEIITATFDSFKNEALKYLGLFSWDLPWSKDACRVELNIQGVPGPQLGTGELYELLKCRRLKRFDEEGEIAPLKVKTLQTLYGDLQDQAWHLACAARGTVSGAASGLKTEAIEDWIEYGKLYQLWNQFKKEDMAILDALNGKLDELNTKIAQFEAKSTQLDVLSTAIQVAQATANAAQTAANTAQGTANQAVSGVSSLQSGIQNGSVVAQRALMLRARDDNHWLRFNKVDKSGNDVFRLWRIDDQWFSTIRVQAADQLLARNDEHWMKHKGVDSEGHDCYGLCRRDNQWFNKIQVAATGNLP